MHPNKTLNIFLPVIALIATIATINDVQSMDSGESRTAFLTSKAQGQHQRPQEITVKISENPVLQIDQGSGNPPLGTTVLLTKDIIPHWKKYNLVNIIRDLHIGVLRYPGGGIGDNYLWDKNTLDRWEGYPTRRTKGKISDPDWLDVNTLYELIKKAPNINTLVLVANFDGAFRVGADPNGWNPNADAPEVERNIKKYAELAGRWARDARRKLGEKYTLVWELGSETYFQLGSRSVVELKPKDYAKALKIFYKEIKDNDPRSIVAAAGPLHRNARSRKNMGSRYMYTWDGRDADYSAKDWWRIVAEIAGGHFDQATFHMYKSPRLKGFVRPLNFDKFTEKATDFIQKKTPNNVTFSLTEFNGSDRDTGNKNLTGMEHVLDMSEQMGDYFSGGIDMIIYWGFRTNGFRHNLVSMYTRNGEPVRHPPYYMLRMWSQYLQRKIYQAISSDDKTLYTFATGNNNKSIFSLFLVNRSTEEKIARFSVSGLPNFHAVTGETMFEDGVNNDPITRGKGPKVDNDVAIQPLDILEKSSTNIAVSLPGRSFSVLSIRK